MTFDEWYETSFFGNETLTKEHLQSAYSVGFNEGSARVHKDLRTLYNAVGKAIDGPAMLALIGTMQEITK